MTQATTATTAPITAPATDAQRIGGTVRERRSALGMSQQMLAERAGLPAAQTVSEIEQGKRELRAVELVRVAQALHTDPTALLGIEAPRDEPRVLWRRGSRAADRVREAQLLERARRYAQLERWCNEEPTRALPSADLDPGSASEREVEHLAAAVRRELDLGPIPARALVETLEEDYGVKIFYEHLTRDADGDCSAACVRSDEFGAAILMDASEAPWRQSFNFAHELFHLVTWNAVERAWAASGATDDRPPSWYKQLEWLADHFASTLLMPAESLTERVDARAKDGTLTPSDLAQLAAEFGVSVQALVIRLAMLGRFTARQKKELLQDTTLSRLSKVLRPPAAPRPIPFPERYVTLARTAYVRREIGKAVVAQYLEKHVAELADLHLPPSDVSQTAIVVA